MLNRSRSYAEIIGLPGVAYEQDGRRFDSSGKEIEALDFEPVEERAGKTPDDILPAVTVIEAQTPPGQSDEGKSLEKMHWRHLKAMVETYGGEWTNTRDAVTFLRGK